MRRVLRIALWSLLILVAIPVLLIGAVLVAANVEPGRALIARETESLTGGMVHLEGIGGRFPDALRIARIEVRDARGTWLAIEDAALDWRPSRLLSREADIDRLTAARVAVARLPESAPASPNQPSSGGSSFSLPMRVQLRSLQVARAEIGAPVAGAAAVFALDGHAAGTSLDDAEATVQARRLDSPGEYDVAATLGATRLAGRATVREPAGGLISTLAGQPALGAIDATATLDGPRDAAAVTLALAAGALRADAHGTLDLVRDAADLAVAASAPAMAPSPSLAWQSVAIDAHAKGPFARPDATGTVRVTGLAAAGATIAGIAADLDGNAGRAHVHAQLDGIHLPGPKPDLLAAAPVVVDADARLDAPERPVSFRLAHPLVAIDGSARTAGDVAGEARITLPDLAPIADAGGVDLHGRAALHVAGGMANGATEASADGTVAITGGLAPVPALIGESGTIAVAATLRGQDVTLSRLDVAGRAITLGAHGALVSNVADLNWTLALSDLATLAPTISGSAKLAGHVAGPLDNFAAQATLDGDVAVRGMRRGPVRAALDARGLPGAPAGTLTAEGTLAEAPLAVALDAQRGPDGALAATIKRLDWKSLHAEGAATLPPGGTLPLGKLDLRMTRLDDLRPLIGQAIAGAVTASVATDPNAARIDVDARGVALPGTGAVDRAMLRATVADPLTHPVVDAHFDVNGNAAGAGGTVRMDARGPQAALALRVDADLRNVAGAPAKLSTAALLNVTDKDTRIDQLQANWRGETLRLLAPVRVGFADGITLDRLRVGLGTGATQATVEVAGRVSPKLDATITARNLTPALARPFAPALDADGTIQADARLTGSPARPSGTASVQARGLRMRSGPGRALPPATVIARADLNGTVARVDVRLNAGRATTVAVTGDAPIDPAGPLGLRATGSLDLALFDPLIAANGRRVRGTVTLDAAVAGTIAAPRATGNARLANGEVQDYALGVHLTDLTALIEAQGDTVRITQLGGHAGPGTLSASGSVGLAAPMPVDLAFTARDARPLSSDRLTATLDANLTLKGRVAETLAAAGTVTVKRAEIHIPERLPASVATLNVRRPGDTPPAPAAAAAPAPAIDLALTVDAPGQVFVRGRGLDAELGGTVHIRGTAANPAPDGGFQLRRGTFSLAGQTLTFSKGEVGFNGGGLSDPSIDFVASSTNGSVTANLEVSGTASAPKITLSSVPELPQDEVLAHLLFGRSASTLSPFELAEIAAALASLSGATSGVGDPLAALRSGLGLDRLSVGGGATGSGPAVQAGRYIAPGVYVGAQQSVSGGGSQATVQVDITRRLKLEGAVGTSSGASNGTATTGSGADAGGSSIGLTYQFEY